MYPKSVFLRPDRKYIQPVIRRFRTCNACAIKRKRCRERVHKDRKQLKNSIHQWVGCCKEFDSRFALNSGDGDSMDITDEFMIHTFAVQENRCFYCFVILGARGLAVDRKDPVFAHSPQNVVFSCVACCKLKGEDYTFEEFVGFAK